MYILYFKIIVILKFKKDFYFNSKYKQILNNDYPYGGKDRKNKIKKGVFKFSVIFLKKN